MLSTLPTVDVVARPGGTVGAWSSPVSELDLEKKLAVQVIYQLRAVVVFSLLSHYPLAGAPSLPISSQ
jgi:hypothetical protein